MCIPKISHIYYPLWGPGHTVLCDSLTISSWPACGTCKHTGQREQETGKQCWQKAHFRITGQATLKTLTAELPKPAARSELSSMPSKISILLAVSARASSRLPGKNCARGIPLPLPHNSQSNAFGTSSNNSNLVLHV